MPARAQDHISEKLSAQLRGHIARNGPMPFSEWMSAALYDPEHGYYQRADLIRWGRAGDYRTAPESSELFGAIWASYFAECHRELGEPLAWTIIEAGPGAGDFAANCLDALRSNHPEVFSATTYLLDEVGEPARARSKERLGPFGDRLTFGRIPDQPAGSLTGVVFANELLDAFPVTRVTKQGGVLGEWMVDVDHLDQFYWRFGPGVKPEIKTYLDRIDIQLAEGQTADVCLGAREWWAQSATVLDRGYLVTVDYGAEAADLYSPQLRPPGSLRAIADHRIQTDPLAAPGRTDLTTSVDWTTIRITGEAHGLETVYFGSLERFLLQHGALEVVEQVSRNRDAIAITQLRHSLRELILPGGLASSFQVLIQSKGC